MSRLVFVCVIVIANSRYDEYPLISVGFLYTVEPA